MPNRPTCAYLFYICYIIKTIIHTVPSICISLKLFSNYDYLTLVLLNCFNCIFCHLKLELLTQFPMTKNIDIFRKYTSSKLSYFTN